MLQVIDYKIKKSKENFNLIGKIKVKLVLFAAFVALLILTTQLVFAASLATDGQKLSQIEQEISKLDVENTTLKTQIAQQSSLKTLSQKAADLGFKKPAQIITP